MKFTIRDLMFILLAVGLHFGLIQWFTWNLYVPHIVALVAAIGLSRPTRSIMFSCGVGALASLASTAALTIQVFQTPIEYRPWTGDGDIVFGLHVILAAMGAGIGAFVGLMMKSYSSATHS